MRTTKSRKRKRTLNAADHVSDSAPGIELDENKVHADLITAPAASSFTSSNLQVGTSASRYEQEAAAGADKIATRTETTSPGPDAEAETKNPVAIPPIVYDVLQSGGKPLDTPVRNFMESRLGEDFRDVTLHTDAKASQSAEAIDAAAYTVGNNIVFRKGQYQPDTDQGKRLIAHELTHVTQQSKNVDVNSTVQRFPFVLTKRVRIQSGSVNIGPGILLKWNGNTVGIEATMEIYGADATASLANDIKSNIEKTWTGTFDGAYSISCKANVTHRAEGTSENGNATQIEIVNNKAPSNVKRAWLVGSRYMTYNLGTADINFTPGHEFGHLLGLGDRYSESIISKLKGKFGGQRTTTVEKGWEGNVMAERGGKLEKKNVEELLQKYAYKNVIVGMPEAPESMEA